MATALTAPVDLTDGPADGIGDDGTGQLRFTAATRVDPDNPLFAGHYPGFPIFPGVCLVECAHYAVLAAAGRRGARLTLRTVRSTRFLNPAFPGDRLDLAVRAELSGTGWECAVVITRDGTGIARVRLGYVPSGAPSGDAP